MISNRTYNETAIYWSVEKGQDLKNLAYNTISKGRFKCKEITAHTNQNQNINELFLLKSNTITIQSPSVIDISTNDLVKFRGEFWRVSGVQKKRETGDTQYRTRGDYFTFIQLVGAKL